MAPWSECDLPVKVVRESWRMRALPEMEWLLEPEMLAEGVYLARAVLLAGGGGVEVHVVNETPSCFVVDAGREVSQANMAADVSHSMVGANPAIDVSSGVTAEPQTEGYPYPPPAIGNFQSEPTEKRSDKEKFVETLLWPLWVEYSHILPAIEFVSSELVETSIPHLDL